MVIDGLLSFNFDVVFYSMYSDSAHSSPISKKIVIGLPNRVGAANCSLHLSLFNFLCLRYHYFSRFSTLCGRCNLLSSNQTYRNEKRLHSCPPSHLQSLQKTRLSCLTAKMHQDCSQCNITKDHGLLPYFKY